MTGEGKEVIRRVTRREFLGFMAAGAGAAISGGCSRSSGGARSRTPGQRRQYSHVNPIALGVYRRNMEEAALAGEAIDSYATDVGRYPVLTTIYAEWHAYPPFPTRVADLHLSRSRALMLTWQPWHHEAGVTQPIYALSTIIAGDHDAFIRRWANEAAAWAKPFYLRFAHEMNGHWFPWSAGVNNNTAAEYAQAWRHVHAIFQEENATNVKWVFCPNEGPQMSNIAQSYPGDAYVDWVAIDGYNWGSSRADTVWRSFYFVFDVAYRTLSQLTTKPIMIAETGCTELGGDKAAWIREGFLSDLPTLFPRLKAVIYFDCAQDGTDWRIGTSRGALDAYREVVTTPLYRGRLP
jgi:beta-mannanase